MAHTFLRAPYHILTTTKGRNICGKAPLLPAKTGYGCPRPVRPRRTSARIILICTCSETPLRTSGARSPTTWLCAAETCLDEIFLDVAEDEMEHYAETMRLISWFDPVQAEMLAEEALDVLVMKRPIGKPNGLPPKKPRKRRMSRSPRAKKICPLFNASPRPYKMNCMP